MYAEYEDLLIGRRKNICFFDTITGSPNEGSALLLTQYAIEELLGWDIETAVKKFDRYTIKKLKLDRILDVVTYPSLIAKGDPIYILALIYPKAVRIDEQVVVENMLKNVLDHKIQFPREFFIGTAGFHRYCICLQYLLTRFRDFKKVEDVYSFCCSAEGRRFLSRNRLKSPAVQIGISTADAVYEITKDIEGSELYHSYYRFLEELKKARSNGEKEGDEEDVDS